MEIKVLYEDRYIFCVEKPQGVPSQSDKTGDEDLQAAIKTYVKDKCGIEYTGLLHRLDRPVGGVMVYALNEFANRELAKQIQNRETKKEYLAVVCGECEEILGTLENYIKKLKTINMSKLVDESDKQGKYAKLDYKVLESAVSSEFGKLSLLKIRLFTGRHHQIRLQLSSAGMPIWGDNKYNKAFVKKKEWTQIALWSHSFGFKHPKTKKYVEIKSIPKDIYPFDIFKAIKKEEIEEIE